MTLTPSTIVHSFLTIVTVSGIASNGNHLVFLPSGSRTCAGAAFARATQLGGTISNGTVSVQLTTIGLYKTCLSTLPNPVWDDQFDYLSATQLLVINGSPLLAPPPPPSMRCGPGTFFNSITNQCEIACSPSNGRRMATEVPPEIADSSDDAQILANQVFDAVSSYYLEKHPEVTASTKDEELRSRLKQLFGQPALA